MLHRRDCAPAGAVVKVSRTKLVLLLTWVLALSGGNAALLTGCANSGAWKVRGWVADYESGERRSREWNLDMLVWYSDPVPGRAELVAEILGEPVIKRITRSLVLCRLFRSYEPDRRYIGQYGVARAPALVLVHRDGTYHAMTGRFTTAAVYDFLTGTSGEGSLPEVNPNLPRQARYEWHDDADAARHESAAQGRPILFAFYRKFTRDWSRLEELLMRPEVYGRLSDTVHCRISSLNPWSLGIETEFGDIKLPSLVIADADGEASVLEMPTSYEAVVRFADLSLGRDLDNAGSAAAGAASP